jgi:hypothetical protein
MTIRLANEIRPAEMPPYCSACHNQDPARTYVDFDAACDRGYGDGAAVSVTFDDLIICDECLRSGAEHVGMIDATEQALKIASLEERLTREQKARRQAQTYATNLEDALASRPDPVQVDHRKRPRKEIA